MDVEPSPTGRSLESYSKVREVPRVAEEDTNLSHSDRPNKNTTTMPVILYRIFLTWRSEKFESFCRFTISSNLGCRHVPVVGGDAGFCATGVEGRTGVDIASYVYVGGSSVARQTANRSVF